MTTQRRNVDLDSPTFIDITQSDTVDTTSTLRAIDIFADGALRVTDIGGTTRTQTFTNVAPVFRWVVQIRRVHNTGTTIADASLLGLH